MAEPTQGELYSLLGEVTANSYKSKAEEERKLRRELKRDQYKAMLFQPLINTAATAGVEMLGDVLGDRFLPERGVSLAQQEGVRAALKDFNTLSQASTKLESNQKALVDSDTFLKSTRELNELQYASQLNASSFKDLPKYQQDIFAASYNRPEIQNEIKTSYEAFLTEQTELASKLLNSNNLKQITAALKDPENPLNQSQISRLLKQASNKLGSRLGIVDARNYQEEGLIRVVLGDRYDLPVEQRTESEQQLIDVLLRKKGEDGKYLKGPGGTLYSKANQLKYKIDQTDETIFESLLKDNTFSNFFDTEKTKLAQLANARLGAYKVQDNWVASALTPGLDTTTPRDFTSYLINEGAPIVLQKQKVTDIVLGMERNSFTSQAYNLFIEKLKEDTGSNIKQNAIREQLQGPLSTQIYSRVQDSIGNLIAEDFNTVLQIGSLPKAEAKQLFSNVHFELLQSAVKINPEIEKFGRNPDPSVAFSLDESKLTSENIQNVIKRNFNLSEEERRQFSSLDKEVTEGQVISFDMFSSKVGENITGVIDAYRADMATSTETEALADLESIQQKVFEQLPTINLNLSEKEAEKNTEQIAALFSTAKIEINNMFNPTKEETVPFKLQVQKDFNLTNNDSLVIDTGKVDQFNRPLAQTLTYSNGSVTVVRPKGRRDSFDPLTLEQFPDGGMKDYLSSLQKDYLANIDQLKDLGLTGEELTSRDLTPKTGFFTAEISATDPKKFEIARIKSDNNEIIGKLNIDDSLFSFLPGMFNIRNRDERVNFFLTPSQTTEEDTVTVPNASPVSTVNPTDAAPSSLLSKPLTLINPNVPGLDAIVTSSIQTFSPNNISNNIVATVVDIESEAFSTLEEKSTAQTGHDAHGPMQVKTATAVQPGYGAKTVFDVADELNISYDPKLKDKAIAQTTANFKAGAIKPVTGEAGTEVIRLLQIPEVNIGLGTNLLSIYSNRYKGDIEKILVAYNQGASVGDNFTGDRSKILSEGKVYLERAEQRGLF